MGRKRGMQFIPYDYEAAYNKAMEDICLVSRVLYMMEISLTEK